MQKIPIGQIKENARNPRKISKEAYEKLLNSIREFPEMLELRPLVIDGDNEVIGGNMRLKALKELGYKEVPVILADKLTDEQKKRFVVVDNLPFGEWDYDILGVDYGMDELESYGFDKTSLYFGVDEDLADMDVENSKDVLTVEPPESIVLKERVSIYFDDKVGYDKVKEALLDENKVEKVKKFLLDL